MLRVRKSEFFNCTRAECKQRRFLHLATPASKLAREDENRLRAQNNLESFVLEMLPHPDDAVPPPYHLAYSQVSEILDDPEEMPNLEEYPNIGQPIHAVSRGGSVVSSGTPELVGCNRVALSRRGCVQGR